MHKISKKKSEIFECSFKSFFVRQACVSFFRSVSYIDDLPHSGERDTYTLDTLVQGTFYSYTLWSDR